MRTIQEIHIYILQELQKMNSFAVDNFLPEELDLHINFFIRKFVDNVVGSLKPNVPSNFEYNQRLLDTIRTIVVKDYSVPTYVDANDSVFAHLPADYKHLVADDSELVYKEWDNISKETVTTKAYAYPILDLGIASVIKDFEVKIGGVSKFKLSSVVGYSDGVDVDTQYQLVDILGRDLGTQFEYVYGEFQGYRNVLYLVYDAPTTIATTTTTSLAIGNEIIIPPKEINRIAYKKVDGEVVVRRPNRLHSNANISFIKMNPYEKPVWESPISSISEGKLHVYEDDQYKVTRAIMDYVKKPNMVSFTSSIHPNLPQEAIDLIVEKVITHVKGLISDPSWQTSVQENQLNNN